jgi:hypothetical protein
MSGEYRNTGRKQFSSGIYAQIIARVEETGLTIRELCAADRTLPAASTVYSKVYEDQQLTARYAEALRQRKLSEGAA